MAHKKFPITLNNLTYALTFTVLTSCAGPESYQQKMARYTPKIIGKNQVPEIKTAEFNFKPMLSNNGQKSRTPASAPENPSMGEEGRESNPTNKKLYFLNLYSEYEAMKNYSMEFVGPTVTICPNFHTSLLRHNEKSSVTTTPTGAKAKKFIYDSKKYSDESYIASRPELMLPLSKEEVTPRVIDIIRSTGPSIGDFAVNELVHKALDIHLAKTYSEIRELCEYGVSDNYYIYENLITHIKNNKFEADTKNMNTLLKTTIFSNIALMTSLDANSGTAMPSRAIASVASTGKKSIYATEVMARLNVAWANQYFDYIKVSR
ncbi:MAG: hypothetical protein EHM20_07595 [Alphaproteobacteria bacterium]|nr:MAG: hypothetical protein EHM20_07595 [Alphaproteobacteria bacterium]